MRAISNALPRISVVIPTYRREEVLIASIRDLLALDEAPAEILVIDQTEEHDAATTACLREFEERGSIRWFQLAEPSIPTAMNKGLIEARHDIVLFLDDDIRPDADLVLGHAIAHQNSPGDLVAGRVIQPWEEGEVIPAGGPFRFAGTSQAWIGEFMGGNFSVDRRLALQLGGFDENFVRVAYRFEAEFAHRIHLAGTRIRFEPRPCIHHLKAGGGTRTFGNYLTTWKPDHAVGAYYHALRTGSGIGKLREFAIRPFRAIATRHHLRNPWDIPVTWLAECLGMVWALRLALRGPRYANSPIANDRI